MILVDAEVAVIQVMLEFAPADPDLYPRVRCGVGSVADGDLTAASALSFSFLSEAGRQDRSYAASENILQRLAPTDGASSDVSRQLIQAAAPRGVLGH
jgi:hypothetical protein